MKEGGVENMHASSRIENRNEYALCGEVENGPYVNPRMTRQHVTRIKKSHPPVYGTI